MDQSCFCVNLLGFLLLFFYGFYFFYYFFLGGWVGAFFINLIWINYPTHWYRSSYTLKVQLAHTQISGERPGSSVFSQSYFHKNVDKKALSGMKPFMDSDGFLYFIKLKHWMLYFPFPKDIYRYLLNICI